MPGPSQGSEHLSPDLDERPAEAHVDAAPFYLSFGHRQRVFIARHGQSVASFAVVRAQHGAGSPTIALLIQALAIHPTHIRTYAQHTYMQFIQQDCSLDAVLTGRRIGVSVSSLSSPSFPFQAGSRRKPFRTFATPLAWRLSYLYPAALQFMQEATWIGGSCLARRCCAPRS